MRHVRYDAAVVGAGPAGLAVAATLLDAGVESLLWVDPCFDGGRLSIYGEVPSESADRTPCGCTPHARLGD